MITLIQALGVAGLVAVGWCLLVRRPTRRPTSPAQQPVEPHRVALAQRLGRCLRAFARRDYDEDRDRVLGRAVLASAAVAIVVSPLLGVTVLVATSAAGFVRLSRQAQQRRDQVAAGLSEVIDLVAVALLSGHNISGATAQVGLWIEGPLSEGFIWCSQQAAKGRPIADALEELPTQLGPSVRPLISALIANERHGAPIAAGLAQLSADHRADQRRRAETAARRLPVHLLFPLIVCVLPAFLLLTVLPVVAETFSELDVFASP